MCKAVPVRNATERTSQVGPVVGVHIQAARKGLGGVEELRIGYAVAGEGHVSGAKGALGQVVDLFLAEAAGVVSNGVADWGGHLILFW